MADLLNKYTVIRCENTDGSDNIPYELHGRRGARYGLMRNKKTARCCSR